MPTRQVVLTGNASIYSTLCWIAFDDFEAPDLNHPNWVFPGIVSGHLHKLARAWVDLLSALKGDELAAMGRPIASVGSVVARIPLHFWRADDLKCDYVKASAGGIIYESISVGRREVLAIWPPPGNIIVAEDFPEKLIHPSHFSDQTAQRWASPMQIHLAIKKVYDEAESAGQKSPNINELPKAVLEVLTTSGLTSSSRRIKNLAAGPEYALRRRKPGKTLRSEKLSKPK